MNLKAKIKKLEQTRHQRLSAWLRTLSDAELENFIEQYGGRDTMRAEWLRTITDSELDTIYDNKPGAAAIWRKFDEYKKQNRKARKQVEY
jgi:hypothetical protein